MCQAGPLLPQQMHYIFGKQLRPKDLLIQSTLIFLDVNLFN